LTSIRTPSQLNPPVKLRHLILTLVVALLGIWYFSYYQAYPYYRMWDMDHIVNLDTTVIQSGLTPTHLNHPSFGMYLLLVWSERIAQLVSNPSIFDLTSVVQSLNPLAGMAEHTEYIRAHSPFACLALVLLLWAGLQALFRPGFWPSLLTLLVLGTQESLFLQASFARSELYAVLYWALAIYLGTHAARTGSQRKRWLLIFGSGVALGLMFLTKIQSVVYLGATPIFILLLFLLNEDGGRPALDIPRPVALKWAMHLYLGSLAFFLGVFWVAYFKVWIPPGLGTFSRGYKVNLFAQAYIGVAIVIGLAFARRSWRENASHARVVAVLACTVLITGFFFAYLTHFLIFADPGTSLQYLLMDFKMVFIRKAMQVQGLQISQYPEVLRIQLNLAFRAYAALALALGLFLAAKPWAGRGGAGRAIRNTAILAALFGVVNSLVAARAGGLQDEIWVEPLINTAKIIFLLSLLAPSNPTSRLTKSAALGILAFLVAANLYHNRRTPFEVDDWTRMYGWQDSYFIRHVYEGNTLAYARIMEDFHRSDPAVVETTRLRSREHRTTRLKMAYSIPEEVITHRSIGILAPGFPLTPGPQGFRITEVSQPIRGESFVYLEKSARADRSVYIRRRADYELFLLSGQSLSEIRAQCADAKETSLQITAKQESQSLTLAAFTLPTGCSYKSPPSQPYFVVVKSI
jgi:hypothetical protein